MTTYKGYTIHGSPSQPGGVALDANFTKVADLEDSFAPVSSFSFAGLTYSASRSIKGTTAGNSPSALLAQALVLKDSNGAVVTMFDGCGRLNLIDYSGQGGITALYNDTPSTAGTLAGHYATGARNASGNLNTITTLLGYVVNNTTSSMRSRWVLSVMKAVNTTAGYSQPNFSLDFSSVGLQSPTSVWVNGPRDGALTGAGTEVGWSGSGGYLQAYDFGAGTYQGLDIAGSTINLVASTGVVNSTTPPAGNNTTRIATTAFVRTEVAALIGSAPGTLDTLGEIADALADDADLAGTLTAQINTKVTASGGDVSATIVTHKDWENVFDIGPAALADALQRHEGLIHAAANLDNGQAVLGSSFTLTTTSTFQDTGLSVSLPSAGTYILTANVRATIYMGSGTGFVVAKLYDSTAAADVADSERIALLTNLTDERQSTTPLSIVVTVGGATTIKLYAKREGGGSFTNALIASDSNGRTTLSYIKLTN